MRFQDICNKQPVCGDAVIEEIENSKPGVISSMVKPRGFERFSAAVAEWSQQRLLVNEEPK